MDRDNSGSDAFVRFSADASARDREALSDKICGCAQEQYVNRVVQHLSAAQDGTQQPSRGARRGNTARGGGRQRRAVVVRGMRRASVAPTAP